MSAANLSAGTAVRASGLPVETGPRTASTDAGAKSGFPDLLTKMAAAADHAPSQPAISVTERRWAWGRSMPQAMPARQEAAEGGEPRPATQPVDESDSSADAASALSTPQPAANPSPLDALAMAGVATLSGLPLPTGQGRDAQAPGVAVPQGARERLDVPASPLPATGDAAALQPASADERAVAVAGAPVPLLVTVIGREAHFAPVVQPVLEQPQGPRAAGTSVRASSEQLASVATSLSGQGVAGNGSVAPSSSASGGDGILSTSESESAGTSAATTELQRPRGDAIAQAATGDAASPDAAVRSDRPLVPQAPAAETGTINNARDSRARGIGVLQSAQERLSASAAQPASTGGAGGSVQTPPEEVDATTPPAPARDLRSVVDAAAATQPASIAGQTTRIAQAVPPVLAQASGGRNRDERTASEQGADPGDSVPLLPRAGVAGAGNPIRSSSDRLAVAKPGSEQGGAGDRDAEPGTPAVPTERSALVSANEAPRTSTAVPPPTHQVAGQIVAAANAVQSEGAQPTATLGAKATVSSVVKVLHLELQPADMGTITIRMSLKQDGLDLRVVASRPETARLLQGDQDTLAKLLTSAGYRVEGMAVVAAPTDSAAVPDGRSQAFLPSSTPQQGNSSQSDSRPSGGRPNAEPDPRASRGNPNEDSTDKRRTVRRAGGDVYV